jgi:hypothetical protein
MLGFYRNNDQIPKELETETNSERIESGAYCLLPADSQMLDRHRNSLEFVGPPDGCDNVEGYSQLLAKREALHQWLVSPIQKHLNEGDVRRAIDERIESLVRAGVKRCGLSENRARHLLRSLQS